MIDTKNPAPVEMSSAQSPAGLLKEWAEMVKIEHTVFALPFALTGLVLANEALPSWSVVFWTVVAFAGARAAAMTLNRLIDAGIDARNPRTSARAIPQGKISKTQALVFSVLSFAIMLFAASKLPSLCLKLSPIAIVWLSLYSYTKRFTWLCHIVLGIALGGAAMGGWVAAGGNPLLPGPWILALAVATWVAGFDIIYACQDVKIDVEERLHSLPAKFGVAAALNSSIMLHAVTVLSLLALGLNLHLSYCFWVGLAIVTAMLIYEHCIVTASDLSRVNAAFFNVNGVVSILAFLSILLDRII